jgi:hypothetical protein
MRKKLKLVLPGILLASIAPILLPYMFLYILRMSELLVQEAGGALFFFGFTFVLGIYLVVKGLALPRMRVYRDRLSNPAILGKKYLPFADIDWVGLKWGDGAVEKVTVHLKPGSDAARDAEVDLGLFSKSDLDALTEALRKRGVEVKIE